MHQLHITVARIRKNVYRVKSEGGHRLRRSSKAAEGDKSVQSGAKQQPHSMTAQAKLRAMILDGVLAAGERLYEVPLAERLGVSRTPLRAALARLEQEGLLERRETTGYVVRTFSYGDAIDAIEFRGVLEGTAARLAAERGVAEAELAGMRSVLERLDLALGPLSGPLDFEGYVAANAEFHERLAGLAGSEIIRREVERGSGLAFASPSAFLESQRQTEAFRASLFTAQAQHRALVEAITNREGTRAEAIAREHARLAQKNLQYIMQQDRSLAKRVPGLVLVAGKGEE